MDDKEFRDSIRDVLRDARTRVLEETTQLFETDEDEFKKSFEFHLFEMGDEFGDVNLGDASDLLKLLGSPDRVARSALASAENIGSKARRVFDTIIKGIPSLVIPFVATRYDKIYDRERRRFAIIQGKYPDVFANAKRVFTTDAALVAFMVNPVVLTAAAATKASADVVLNLIDSLGVGDEGVGRIIKRIRRVKGSDLSSEGLSLGPVLLEARNPVEELLADEGFRERLERSSVVTGIKQEAEDVKNETLNDILQAAQAYESARSIEDLSRAGFDAKRYLGAVDEIDDREDLDPIAIRTAKHAAVSLFMKNMELSLEELRSLGVPDDSELFKVYGEVGKRLRKMLA